MKRQRKLSVQAWRWAFYDWANSAFATTVMAGFFPIFFAQYWSNPDNLSVSTFYLGLGNSIASMIIVFLAPILGAIADRGTYKKRFLIFFAFLGILMTAGLALVGQGMWQMALLVYVVATIGFSGANTFYDSLLPAVSNKDNVDYVSALGYSLGYIGGGILIVINFLMISYPDLIKLIAFFLELVTKKNVQLIIFVKNVILNPMILSILIGVFLFFLEAISLPDRFFI